MKREPRNVWNRACWGLTTVVAFGLLGAGALQAQTMSPINDEEGPRNVRPHTQFLSASDLALLERAFDAANRKQWDTARSIAASISNAATRDLVLWRSYVTRDNGAPFSDISRFISTHRDWPNQHGLQARAEEAMPAESMSPSEVIDWFQGRDPVSGEGMFKLGDAFLRKGQEANARNWFRRGWVEGNFSLDRISVLSARYGSHLSTDDHRKRATRLVWANEYGQANAMANWLPSNIEAMISARTKLRQTARDADAAFGRVSAELQKDAGLLFDRARWLRKRGRVDEARPLLLQAAANLDGPAPSAEEWWAERNYQAREALDQGNAQQAYQVASSHAIRKEQVVNFAEAEFLAGWIALKFLNQPETAYNHFVRLREAVTAPISAARGHYWAGRAAEKAGRASEATRQYTAAAQFPITFYGQVAAATLNPKATFELPAVRTTASSSRQAFRDQAIVQAMHALADVGSEGLLRTFAIAAADNFTERDQYVLLTDFLKQLNQQALALRVAKRGIQKNIPVQDIAYPVIALPAYKGNGTPPESALVIGLTRQESEFDPEAQSSAGARGLMQLMPATAALTARRHAIPYRGKAELFTPSTNLQLGMAHVSDLLGDFGGSYILSIAAYNAGGGRSNQWIGRFGDPRSTGVDAIDWIERIPFSETRNYVQRVLENAQVYRAVLAGRAVPIGTLSDVRRGGFTEIAGANAQFTSTPTPQATAAVAAGVAAVAGTVAGTPAKTVIASSPVYDDDEAKPAKTSKPAAKPGKKKKKRRRSS